LDGGKFPCPFPDKIETYENIFQQGSAIFERLRSGVKCGKGFVPISGRKEGHHGQVRSMREKRSFPQAGLLW